MAEEEKKKIKGLVTTIIFGVLLTAALIFVIILLPIDVRKMMNDVISGSNSSSASASESAASASSSGSSAGEVIGRGIAAVFAGAILIVLSVMLIGGTGIPTIVSIPFSIHNVKKANTKAIKIINIVYLGLAAFILTVDIIKLIQLIFL